MAVGKSQMWRTLYNEALLERDPQQLPEKIARAEAASYGRITHLKASPKDQIERQALDDALTSLGVMKKLHFPGWKINRDSTERKKSEQELLKARAQLEQSNKSLRQLSASLLRAQDEERRRIARELHDSTGQALAALIIGLTALRTKVQILDPKLADIILDHTELARQLATDLRTTSYLLHPPLLEETGLVSALRWYIDGFRQRSNIQVSLELPADSVRLPRDLELALFRVVQECLTNIHRHSGSPTAAIRVQCGDELTLQVSDQGKGLSPEELARIASGETPGVGLRGMRERLRVFNAKMNVLSNETGTSIQVSIPLTSTEGRPHSIALIPSRQQAETEAAGLSSLTAKQPACPAARFR